MLLADADLGQGSSLSWGAVASDSVRTGPTVTGVPRGMHQPDQLPRLAAGFDFVIVDCPPTLGDVTRSALMVADLVVIPCTPSQADLWAVGKTLEVVTAAQSHRPELRAVILMNQVVARSALRGAARQALEATGFPVLRTELGTRMAYREAIGMGLGPSTCPGGKKSPAGSEVRALTDEVLAILAPPAKRKAARRG